jgi:hypothetical protein
MPVAPFVRAWRWGVAQRAIEEGRPEDALDALRAIEALAADDPAAALLRAHLVGRDLATLETTPEGRFRRIAEALAVLDRAFVATGERALLVEKGAFLLEAWSGERALAEAFAKRYGRTPVAAAVEALAMATTGAPRDGRVTGRRAEAWRIFGEAQRLRAIELVVADGAWSLAVESARAAAAAFVPEERDLAAAALAAAWSRFLAAATEGTRTSLDAATEEFVRTLRAVSALGGAGQAETWFAASILPRLIELGEQRLAADGASVALSVVSAADSIRRFVDAGAPDSEAASTREKLSRTAVVRLLEGVKSSEPALASDANRIAESLLRPFDR